MTKVIQFGGSIDLDLPEGIVLTNNDKAEVLSATVIGSNDELLCRKEITLGHYGQQPEQGEGKRRNNCLLAQKQQMGCGNKESLQQVAFPGCSDGFEPALYQYGKLREKMAIEILVKAVRVAHINVVEE